MCHLKNWVGEQVALIPWRSRFLHGGWSFDSQRALFFLFFLVCRINGLDYILGNYRHARSVGGRQPAGAKNSSVVMVYTVYQVSHNFQTKSMTEYYCCTPQASLSNWHRNDFCVVACLGGMPLGTVNTELDNVRSRLYRSALDTMTGNKITFPSVIWT